MRVKPMALNSSRRQVRLYLTGAAQNMLALPRKLSVARAREGLVAEVSLTLTLNK